MDRAAAMVMAVGGLAMLPFGSLGDFMQGQEAGYERAFLLWGQFGGDAGTYR